VVKIFGVRIVGVEIVGIGIFRVYIVGTGTVEYQNNRLTTTQVCGTLTLSKSVTLNLVVVRDRIRNCRNVLILAYGGRRV
jgi:hypothetical protein